MFCSRCGAFIAAGAHFCPQCSLPLGPAQVAPEVVQGYAAMPHKDATVAALLAILLGLFGLLGIGHIYIGRVARGVVLLVVGLVFLPLAILFLFFGFAGFAVVNPGPRVVAGAFALILLILLAVAGWFVLLIWQAFDAYSLANEYNRRLDTSGVPPW